MTATTQQVVSTVDTLLAAWLPHQRWFVGKNELADGQVPEMDIIATLPLTSVQPAAAQIRIHLVRCGMTLYQIPLTYRTDSVPRLADYLLGTVDPLDGSGATQWVYDGPHDPAFVHEWLTLLDNGYARCLHGRCEATGVRHHQWQPIDVTAPCRVGEAEQSNTSVIVTPTHGKPIIVKLFRTLTPGENPEVVISRALAHAKCPHTPAVVGWVEATWQDNFEGASSPMNGHLAVAAEFVPETTDGWQLALNSLETTTPFDKRAYDLGRVTADIHERLAKALQWHPASEQQLADLAGRLDQRVKWACQRAPQLREFQQAAHDVIDVVRHITPPPVLQHIHGDYHLGQVLWNADRGWLALDFEGEPLRAVRERMTPEMPLRDVAGMLRSFDYAAAHASIGLPADDPAAAQAQEWMRSTREAFLAGYLDVCAHSRFVQPLSLPALRAFELDKALYEVVYEVQHRPTWTQVPLAAVQRLLEG